ncbi:exocyst complex component EXO70B1-like [Arachis ipaensis]|uniref:exocyst complex component EXO70B1-like n=1 Tax=Arachis ipaensis TaxID=130454 RepID=UPI000A2B10F5|nr:exocyst complex component EXO70B1-like [Arachis ipaensis]
MTPLSVQIPSWLMHQKLWRFLGFASSIVGLLCYALSTSFNFLFGKWNLAKISIYIVFSLIICLATFFAKVWQYSASLRLRAHMTFLVLTVTSVYSFFFDKAANGDPDAYSIVSCASFAIMWFSLSRQIHCGFEVDMLYFFLGVLIIQLMKIRFLLSIVAICFSYFLIILRSSLDASTVTESEYLELHDQNHVSIQVESDSQQSNIHRIIMTKLMDCVEALQKRKAALVQTIFEEYNNATNNTMLVTDYNFLLDTLPQGVVNDLHEAVKSAVAFGLVKECSDAYIDCRREFLEECLARLLELDTVKIDHPNTLPTPYFMVKRWAETCNVAFRILFPFERRLCDRVFFGLRSVSDVCFANICRESATQLLNFAEAFTSTLFCDSLTMFLVKEAITIQNNLREAIEGCYTEVKNMIFRSKKAKFVFPNGGIHPLTMDVLAYVELFCEPFLQKYVQGSDRAGTSFSFSVEMVSMLKILERKLRTKSKNYKDPTLCYFFMMINRRYIQNFVKQRHFVTHLSNDWVQNNTQKAEQNLELYYKSSWNMVVDYLKLYNDEKICTLQSTWFVGKEQLRKEIITSVENMLLPAYGNFIGKFHNVLAADAYEYIEYGMFDIQARLNGIYIVIIRLVKPKSTEDVPGRG